MIGFELGLWNSIGLLAILGIFYRLLSLLILVAMVKKIQ